MKRTTYIFIAMYLGGMVLILIGFFSIKGSFLRTIEKTHTIEVTEKTTSTDLSGIKKVVVLTNYPSRFSIDGQNEFNVVQAEKGTSGKIVYSAAEFIKAEKHNEVLTLTIDYRSVLDKYEESEYRFNIEPFRLQMEIPDTYMRIENETATGIRINNVKMDSLEILSKRNIDINDCNFDALLIKGHNRIQFSASNTTINNLHADVDDIRSWEFNNSTVKTQYLTGSNDKFRIPYNNKGSQIIWEPKDN